jgi:hypothetical protein
MEPKSTRSSPSSAARTTESTVDLQEQVRRRAYELYEQRGREDGHELDDWLQAESEVVQRRARTVAA